MAYAFDRIDTLLRRRNAEGDNEARNVAPLISSNSEGSSNLVPQKSSRIGGRYSKAAAGSAATEALKDKVKVPGFLGTVSGDIQKSYANIDKNVEDYTKREKDLNEKTYKPINTELANRAASGDEGAFSRIRNVLSDTTGRDISRPEFKLPNVTKIPDVGTRSGLEQLYRTGRKPTYTKGMAEFDVNLAQGTRGLSDKISKLAAEQNKLLPYARDKYKTAFEEAQKNNLDSLEAAKKSISSYLSEEEGKLTEAQKAEGEALAKRLENLYAKTGEDYSALEENFEKYFSDKLKPYYHPTNYRNRISSIFRSKLNKDQADREYIDYVLGRVPYKRGTGTEDKESPFYYRNLFNENEAGRYNRIIDLLDKQNMRVPENKDISFDFAKPDERAIENIFDKMASEGYQNVKDYMNKYASEMPEDIDFFSPFKDKKVAKHMFDMYMDSGHVPYFRDLIAGSWNNPREQDAIRDLIKSVDEDNLITKWTNSGMSVPQAIRNLPDDVIARALVASSGAGYNDYDVPDNPSKALGRLYKESSRSNILTAKEAELLNRMAKEIGSEDTYFPSSSRFKSPEVKEYLRRVLARKFGTA